MKNITIVGAGLAGCEAAYQAAKRGVKVKLFEMKPTKYSPAHHSENFAELVCSNSLRSDQLENAVGLLKEEMRALDSLIMKCADSTRVPAGGALAVDREEFSRMITNEIKSNSNIEVINEEVTDIPNDDLVIIATGPLTSSALSQSIKNYVEGEYFYFYDAAAPIVTYESINMNKIFKAARYGKGEADYLNCPMTKEEYDIFYNELVTAECAQMKEFEKEILFEGCMPIESMAKRGVQTMLFGPLKPVGLIDPNTNKQPFAVVQLRQDNKEGTLYNIVGFQTHLKWNEQKRVFSLIPGLESAEFVRFGVMHRNTYINSPKLLCPTLQLKNNTNILFAGQITGVEGYIESASNGLIAGINGARIVYEKEPLIFPQNTAHGALCHYISSASIDNFQPMNVNFGIFPAIGERIADKKEKNRKISQKALETVNDMVYNVL